MANPVPTSCPCGEVHPSKGDAAACRTQLRAMLRLLWSRGYAPGKRPTEKDAPAEVWEAARVVIKWVAGVQEERVTEWLRDKRRMWLVRVGSGYFGWSIRLDRRLWHVVEFDYEAAEEAESAVCGAGPRGKMPRGHSPVCPDCRRWARAHRVPAKPSEGRMRKEWLE